MYPYGVLLEPHAKEAETLNYNLVLDTQWEHWSTCSKCDDIGKRHKLGYCIIYLKDNYRVNAHKIHICICHRLIVKLVALYYV